MQIISSYFLLGGFVAGGKNKKTFKVLGIYPEINLVELLAEKDVILLYRAKKQTNISSTFKRGDLVFINDGYLMNASLGEVL